MYNYNFIFFDAPENKFKIDRTGYYAICSLDLCDTPFSKVVSYPLDTKPLWVRFLFAIHNSAKIEKKVNLPFKQLWYPYYFKNDFDNNKPLCFIILNHSLPIPYLKYLKKRYPDCKLVMIHRDFLRVSQRCNPLLPQNPILDLEMTYDEGESLKYGFPHFDEYESKVNIKVEDKFESDIFFAGRAKDRLPALMAAYDKFKENGLNVFYYLTGVPLEDRIPHEGITYADQNMDYLDMLYHTVNTRCVLEITQGKQKGYTSRFLEAVIYGKKLITDCDFIRNSKFYNGDKIQIVSDFSSLDLEFVKNGDGFVDYNYKEEFSPLRLLDRVNEELSKQL